MANELVYLHPTLLADDTGFSAVVYDSTGLALTTVSLTDTNSTAIYTANFPSTITTAGTYYYRIIDAAALQQYGSGQVFWDGSEEQTLKTNNDLLVLIQKYHNNKTEFFDSDGLTRVTQGNAYSMVVYDDDGTTVIKTIEFFDSSDVSTTLTNAVGYQEQ